MVASTPEQAGAAGEEPQTALKRFDHWVHQAEQGLITGALLVMTITYFLQIVHREMQSSVNAFDRLVLRLKGFETVGEAPEDVLASVTGTTTPWMLGVVAFVLAVLAVRTRERSGLAEGESPPPVNWLRRLGLSVLVVGATLVFLMVVKHVPAKWVCLVSVAGLLIPAMVTGVRDKDSGSVVGAALGAVAATGFFLTKVDTDYIWSVELSSVLLMYVGFLGASMATKHRRHIQVDFIRKKMPDTKLPLYNAVSGTVTVLFCVFLLILATYYVSNQLGHGGQLPATQLPEVLVSFPIAFSVTLMTVRFTAGVIRDVGMWRRGETYPDTGPELH